MMYNLTLASRLWPNGTHIKCIILLYIIMRTLWRFLRAICIIIIICYIIIHMNYNRLPVRKLAVRGYWYLSKLFYFLCETLRRFIISWLLTCVCLVTPWISGASLYQQSIRKSLWYLLGIGHDLITLNSIPRLRLSG